MLPSGWVVPIPIALPNIIWAVLPKGPAAEASSPLPESRFKALKAIEGVGRIAVFVIPFFLELHVTSGLDLALGYVGALALVVYYAGWARYFRRGRASALLLAPLGGLPVPLAISPVLYFLAFAGVAQSLVMGTVVVVFGAAHIFLSLKRASAA